MLPRTLSRVVGWAKARRFYSLQFEERGESLWAFMRTWEKGTFRRVAVTVSDRFAVDATLELSVIVTVVAAAGGSASLAVNFGGSHLLADTYGEYLGSGYKHKLVQYPIFDLLLLKRCLQKASSSVFGSLDPFSMTEFIVTRLNGAEHRDWMMSRSSLRRAIITEELSMPSLVEVVSDIVGVWPLIVVYLKETGRKTDGDSLVVKYILHFLTPLQFSHLHLAVFLEQGNRWLFLYRSDGEKQIPPVPSDSRDLLVQLLVLSSSGSRGYVYIPESFGRIF